MVRAGSYGAGGFSNASGGLAQGAKGLMFADWGRGARVNSGGQSATPTTGTSTRTYMSLGGAVEHDHNRAAFKVAEILIVDPTLFKGDGEDNHRWVLEGMLAHKWGVQALLPDLHPFGRDCIGAFITAKGWDR